MIDVLPIRKDARLSRSAISDVVQICIVTRNFDSTVRELADRFGIGPFKCWNHSKKSLINTELRGENLSLSIRVALTWVGNIQLEVIQPLEGISIYDEYLEEHGEGVQHILARSSGYSFRQTVENLSSSGFSVIQMGMVNVPIKIGFLTLPRPRFAHNYLCPRFVYFDTEQAIKTSIELIDMPLFVSYRLGCKIGKGDFWIPQNNTDIESELDNSFVDRIYKIGIITHNLESTIQSYAESLNISSWKIYTIQSPENSEVRFSGDTLDCSYRCAISMIGETWVEIVQPIYGSSLYQRVLDVHGEGIHYLGVVADGLDFQGVIDTFSHLECPVIMDGEVRNDYRFAFFDTRPFINVSIEVVSLPLERLFRSLSCFAEDYTYFAD